MNKRELYDIWYKYSDDKKARKIEREADSAFVGENHNIVIITDLKPGDFIYIFSTLAEVIKTSKTTSLENLFLLSGMKYKNGYFDSLYWHEKTGVNPLNFPEYIEITNGSCFWNEKAEAIYQANSDKVSRNWVALGINNK